ncbi:hypothetical protein GCM10007424_19160 [Flavobacterium suaedae]|uniref:DUF4132 domain-containing protein n=1 Tax=Flavobacterium suaedae TaxID=1767027 RepID=A0ABQ1JWA7_9FLAO|nr:contractile injection system tape measure protein [Flavobacterium suaedae]GGB79171.1 hypothetical protein GCM10007424_19160 [Flavobacterium suaedae]
MAGNNTHIISSLKWDTLFGNKEKAFELQEKISDWSRIHMQRTILEVFDAICPPEQTWRISNLELNLGSIDFDNYDTEMAARLQQQLREQLTNLILQQYNRKQNIEILHEDSSLLQLIENYLLYGFIPWTYKSASGSLNEMLKEQLVNNEAETIALIKRLGIRHNNVRKRIAWQVSEENIKLIVKGLEPSNYTHITDFNQELITVQQKKPIIKTDLREFKKHLWYWVLNYLLSEKGSVFNRLAFAKSNLIQMAAHYNVSYAELLGLIEEAITIIAAKHAALKPEFITNLQALIKENTSGKSQQKDKEGTLSNWVVLQEQLSTLNALKSPAQINTFNDLLIQLSKENSGKVRALLNTTVKDKTLLIEKLSPITIEMLLGFSYQQTSSFKYREVIATIEATTKQLSVNYSKAAFLKDALRSVITDNKTFSTEQLLDSYIQKVTKRFKTSKSAVVSKLYYTNAGAATKSKSLLKLQHHLEKTIQKETPTDFITLFREQLLLLGKVINNIQGASTHEKLIFISLKQAFLKNVALNPVAAFKALKQHPDKKEITQWINFLLDENYSKKILNKVSKKASEVITAILKISNNNTTPLVENHIYTIGLQVLISQKRFDTRQYTEQLLSKLETLFYNNNEQSYFDELITALQQEKAFIALHLPIIQQHKKQERKQPLPLIEKIKFIINTTTNEQEKLSRLLNLQLSKAAFSELKNNTPLLYKKLLNYLLKDADVFLPKLSKTYTAFIQHYLKGSAVSTSKLNIKLEELFFQTLILYPAHGGSKKLFIQQFKKAIFFTYPIQKEIEKEKEKRKTLHTQNNAKTIFITGKESLPLTIAVKLLKQGLQQGSNKTKWNNIKYNTRTILIKVLEYAPREVQKLLTEIPYSKERADIIADTVSFENFSLWIFQSAQGKKQEEAQSLQQLYHLFLSVLSGSNLEKATALFWSALWDLAANKKGSTQIFNDVFSLLTKLTPKGSTKHIEKKIRESNSYSTHTIKLVAKYFTINSAYNSTFGTFYKTSGVLLKAKRKGLLYTLAKHLVQFGQLSSWAKPTEQNDKESISTALNTLIQQEPFTFLLIIKQEPIAETQWQWLQQTINFKTLVKAAGTLSRNKETILQLVEQLYYNLEAIKLKSISYKKLQNIVFRKFITAWRSGNWQTLSAKQIWNEIFWECQTKYGIKPHVLIKEFKTVPYALPPALLVSLRETEKHYQEEQMRKSSTTKNLINMADEKKPAPDINQSANTDSREMIPVKNAGMVLLNNYILMLLDRLGLTQDGKFKNEEYQEQAVHYLQYLVTGLEYTEEFLLPLNKLLCGIPLEAPITDGFSIKDDEKKLIESLLEAAINYWAAIGKSSIEGLRGNFLVRDGLLSETEDRWELKVEKRPYDILIAQSPFSFSIIKYPWMNKPLHVTWAY